MPTIREIADGCGVTKQTVTARLRELGLWDAHVQKDGRTFVVDAMAASAVAASIAKRDESSQPNDGSGRDSHVFDGWDALQGAKEANEALKTALIASQDQIRTLTRELDAKNDQIRELSDRLAASQSAQERSQATIDRLASRSWVDRLLGRGLPAPK